MADSQREEIAKLETLYANNPEGRVFTHLAEAYRKAGELGRAREILEEGLRRHSDYSSAHVVLGRVLSDQGDPEAAAAAFRRVLELDRHNLVALRSLGEVSIETGHTDEALHYYRELLSLDPSDEALRGTVRSLEEHRDEQAAAAVAAPPASSPTDDDIAPIEPAPAEPSGEPPAVGAGEPVPTEPEPSEIVAGPAVPFFPDVDAAAVSADAGETAADGEPFGGPVSENWEEDVGIELEPLPGDLAALTGEPTEPEPLEGLETGVEEQEWAVTGEWLGQPPADPLASGLDLGIEGEEIGRVELPAADLDLTEPPSEDLTPFDMPSGRFDLAADEPPGPTPFDGLDAEVTPETAYGGEGPAGDFGIDVGPATPEFGGPAGTEPAIPARVEPDFGAGEGELVTETMAELYFAQGAYARAADVYRSLLRNRPDDARLRERLTEAESHAAGPGWQEEDAGEAWLEGVESAWTGGGGVAGAEATPYAWAEPRPDEAPPGPRLGEYLTSLLAWRPGGGTDLADGGGQAAAVESPAEMGGGPAYEGAVAAAAETEAPAYLPIEALEEPSGGVEATEAEPWDAPEPTRPPELPEAASVAGADEDGGDDDEDLEMFRSWLQSLRK